MISKELRKQIYQRYNIEDSLINRPIHYSIPKSIETHPYLILNNPKEDYFKKIINKAKTKLTYSRNKEKIIKKTKLNIQRNKVDILFSKTYDKINNNLRINTNNLIPKKRLETLSDFTKGKYIDDITNKSNFYNDLFKKNTKRIHDNYFFDKQNNWSNIYLEQKLINKYKNDIYTIKYMDTLPFFPKKIYYKHKYEKDETIPVIVKLSEPINSGKNKNKCRSISVDEKSNIVKNHNFTINKNKHEYAKKDNCCSIFKRIPIISRKKISQNLW
jgi:hypothetical protein